MTRVKYSKNGWPLSATLHNLGFIVAERWFTDLLIERVNKKFFSGEDVVHLKETDTNCYFINTRDVRLSMERYNVIRSYIDGFKDGAR